MADVSKPAILCVGRLYCDLIFTDVPRLPSMGTEVFAGGLGLHAGGGAFITAAWLASLGHRTELAGHLPNAPFHDVVVADLKAARLGLGLCRPLDPALDTQLTVAIVGACDRAFLTRRSGAAAPDITAHDLRRIGARHLHIGELSTLLERPDLLSVAREIGATVSLDCAWDDDLPVAQVPGLLAQVDVFLPNDAEVRHLLERGVPEPFAPLTVVKKGAQGSSAIIDAREIAEPAERVRAVDTTGAGDAFNAGFLSAWLAGQPLPVCLRAGNALGARAIVGRGGFRAGAETAERARELPHLAG
jgi:sugar/nucleoside kinase (ribokinase family)